jgi:hypothetical protein
MNPDVMSKLYHMLPLLTESPGQLKSNTRSSPDFKLHSYFFTNPEDPINGS